GLGPAHGLWREVADGEGVAAGLGGAIGAFHRLMNAPAIQWIGLVGGIAYEHHTVPDNRFGPIETRRSARDRPATRGLPKHPREVGIDKLPEGRAKVIQAREILVEYTSQTNVRKTVVIDEKPAVTREEIILEIDLHLR